MNKPYHFFRVSPSSVSRFDHLCVSFSLFSFPFPNRDFSFCDFVFRLFRDAVDHVMMMRMMLIEGVVIFAVIGTFYSDHYFNEDRFV